MKTRSSLLNEKEREFRQQAEEWARKEKILHRGEYVHLTLRIRTMRTSPPFKVLADPLHEADWRKIFELRWSHTRRNIFEYLYRNRNQPVKVKELLLAIADESPRGLANSDAFGALLGINPAFERRGLPYRLMPVQKRPGRIWPTSRIRLMKVMRP